MATVEHGEEDKKLEFQGESAAEEKGDGDVEDEAKEEVVEDEKEKPEEDEKENHDEAVTPNERPTRERKTVERYSAPSSHARSSGPKPLKIAKGSGTMLKDIPNVTYKISKRKPDDNLQLLHTILYGRKAKVHNLKKDIGLFSGFVWVENEEKQRAKVKEKLDKCVKEKLLDFCDVLNIPVNRSSTKKEDLLAKLLEFLQSPHATTDVLLADKEQKGKKRKSKETPSRSSSSKERSTEKSSKKAKIRENQNKTSKSEEESADEDKDENSDATDESMEDGDKKELKEESREDEINSEDRDESKAQTPTPKSKEKSGSKSRKTPTDIKKNSSKKPSETKEKSKTTPKKSNAAAKDSTPPSRAKESRTKKQTKSADEKDSGKKQSGKSRSKGKASKKENTGPSKEEMHPVVANILQEVDFNTATLSDILRKLGTHFGLDLMHRKPEVKEIITDIMNSMSDDDEEAGDAGEGESNAEKDKADNA